MAPVSQSAELRGLKGLCSNSAILVRRQFFPRKSLLLPKNCGEGFLSLIWPRRLAAIAAIAMLAILSGIISFRKIPPIASRPGWEVAQVEGAPTIGSRSIQGPGAKGKLEVGQLLVTNANSRASITVAEIGEIQVDPDRAFDFCKPAATTNAFSSKRERFTQQFGRRPANSSWTHHPLSPLISVACTRSKSSPTVQAFFAPHSAGWASICKDVILSSRPAPFVQRAAVSALAHRIFRTRPNLFTARSPNWIRLTDSEARSSALQTILSQARKEDALSLWHLLSRTEGPTRAGLARFAALVPPPQGVTRDGVLRLDQQQLDLGGTSSTSATFPSGVSGSRPDSPEIASIKNRNDAKKAGIPEAVSLTSALTRRLSTRTESICRRKK